MEIIVDKIPGLTPYQKALNAYNPSAYPAHKRITAEEWNALMLSGFAQGNRQEHYLEQIINGNLTEIIETINSAIDKLNNHELRIVVLETGSVEANARITAAENRLNLLENNKVNKLTTSSAHTRVYARKANGEEVGIVATSIATAEALVIRDGEGSSKITTLPDDALGASEFDIANRSYVQQKLAEMPGDLVYKGAWDASTNTPALSPAVPEESGDYYKVSVSGVWNGTKWDIGDWIISNGVEWQKIDNSDTPFSTEPEGDRLVMRTPDGRAKVKDAVDPDDAVTKKQLEDIEAQDILTLADAVVLTDENGLPIEDEEGRYIVPEDVDKHAREQLGPLNSKTVKLHEATTLTDQNGEPLEDQEGKYLIPEDVDIYARLLVTMDKIGDNSVSVDLSNPYDNMFGTIDNPIEISTESTITFKNFMPIPNYQKSFILYIKRTADVAVHWGDITAWVRNEIPLLPVDKVQKILVETVDGINYYGTGGPMIDV